MSKQNDINFDFQKHAEEKDRKRMDQYNNPEEHSRYLIDRSRKMRENDNVKIIK